MTSRGPLPLKKYSTGGVATSPQLALFGEGSQNEAFVPLPDGRSIPVTMNGGGGDVVISTQVTVNNSDGGENDNNDGIGGNYKKLADMINGQVRTIIVTEKRPGGLLYAGR